MSTVYLVVALVVAQRLAELAYATRNTSALLRRGGVEHGRAHYALFIALHGSWLVAILLTVPPQTPIAWGPLIGFIALQALRIWIVATLGPYWTTRIISLPGVPLVRRGPYRLMRHPNYAVVAGEIVLLPLAFGAWVLALVFGVLNLLLLAWRIRIEERVLAPRRILAPVP